MQKSCASSIHQLYPYRSWIPSNRLRRTTQLILAIVSATVFVLIFVVIIIVGRIEIDGIHQNSTHAGIDLHKDVSGAPQGWLGGVSGADDKNDRVGTRRHNYCVGD